VLEKKFGGIVSSQLLRVYVPGCCGCAGGASDGAAAGPAGFFARVGFFARARAFFLPLADFLADLLAFRAGIPHTQDIVRRSI